MFYLSEDVRDSSTIDPKSIHVLMGKNTCHQRFSQFATFWPTMSDHKGPDPMRGRRNITPSVPARGGVNLIKKDK